MVSWQSKAGRKEQKEADVPSGQGGLCPVLVPDAVLVGCLDELRQWSGRVVCPNGLNDTLDVGFRAGHRLSSDTPY